MSTYEFVGIIFAVFALMLNILGIIVSLLIALFSIKK